MGHKTPMLGSLLGWKNSCWVSGGRSQRRGEEPDGRGGARGEEPEERGGARGEGRSQRGWKQL